MGDDDAEYIEDDDDFAEAMDMNADTGPGVPHNIHEQAHQLMGLAGIEDFDQAKQCLALFNYDLNAAAASFLDGSGPVNADAAADAAKGPLGAEFSSLYEARFGLLHPAFFMEDYEAALRTAKTQGRMVLVYVYSDYEEDASDHF